MFEGAGRKREGNSQVKFRQLISTNDRWKCSKNSQQAAKPTQNNLIQKTPSQLGLRQLKRLLVRPAKQLNKRGIEVDTLSAAQGNGIDYAH